MMAAGAGRLTAKDRHNKAPLPIMTRVPTPHGPQIQRPSPTTSHPQNSRPDPALGRLIWTIFGVTSIANWASSWAANGVVQRVVALLAGAPVVVIGVVSSPTWATPEQAWV